MSNLTFIDVSGVGNSGKTAAVDILREIDGFFVPHFQFEFDLLRVRGGLIDLRHALVDDWSPIRSHATLNDFIKTVSRMGGDPKGWWDLPTWFGSTSQRYDRQFNGELVKSAHEFARSFVVGSYMAEWPYDDLQSSHLIVFARKLFRRFGGRSKLLRTVQLVDGQGFDEKAKVLLTNLYKEVIPQACDYVVLNNGFEPFNPTPFFDMIEGARQIIVTRDPRDVFVSGLNQYNIGKNDKQLSAFDNDGLNKSFLATDDVDVFIKRYRLYHSHLYTNDSRILSLRFEDIVLNYSQTLSEIFEFLKVSPSRHIRPRTSFDPQKSARNVGVWKHYSRQDVIRYLENNLAEFLV